MWFLSPAPSILCDIIERDVFRRHTNRVAYRQNILILIELEEFLFFLKIDFILEFLKKGAKNSHPNVIFHQYSVIYAAKSFDSFSQKYQKINDNIGCLNRKSSGNLFIEIMDS